MRRQRDSGRSEMKATMKLIIVQFDAESFLRPRIGFRKCYTLFEAQYIEFSTDESNWRWHLFVYLLLYITNKMCVRKCLTSMALSPDRTN